MAMRWNQQATILACLALAACTRPHSATIAATTGERADGSVSHLTPAFLAELRALVRNDRARRPIVIRYEVQSSYRLPRGEWLENGGPDSVRATIPVFQIRYADRWIAVDAAFDRSYVPSSRFYREDAHERIDAMLARADRIVLTHEHFDHVGGILRSPRLERIRAHAFLTDAQRMTLVDAPYREDIRLTPDQAARYGALSYRRVLRLAPGVVLVSAPGHSPGSQLVYVQLTNGREVILAGDAAWLMDGIRSGARKPLAWTARFGGERREQVDSVMAWLRDIGRRGVEVVISHDHTELDSLEARGAIVAGFDTARTVRSTSGAVR